nr:unnamed protein product [Callosobruchus chinensis]
MAEGLLCLNGNWLRITTGLLARKTPEENEASVVKGQSQSFISLVTRAICKDIKDLKSLIIQLQNEIKDLKAENIQNSKKLGFVFEDVFAELTERQRQGKNIIIFNVDEPDQNKPAAEQTFWNNTLVSNLPYNLQPDFLILARPHEPQV